MIRFISDILPASFLIHLSSRNSIIFFLCVGFETLEKAVNLE